MSINEFRLGNWILIDGRPIQISKLIEDSNMFKSPLFVLGIEYSPIILSGELLRNSKFREYNAPLNRIEWEIELDDRSSIVIFQDMKVAISIMPPEYEEGSVNYYYTPVRHLHELQNLYFSLTKCELQIQL